MSRHKYWRGPLYSMLRALLLALLLLPLALAEPPSSELYNADELTLRLQLGNSVNIVPQGFNPRIDFLSADLTWYPRESYRQHVQNFVTTPEAEKTLDSYRFFWMQPSSNILTFSFDALVETSAAPLPVRTKERFPIKSMPAAIGVYTEEGELINSNEAIREKAFALAGEKTDLFEVVYAVADWVTLNIEYNLTSITAEATQPSTWVMEQRQGVCDELTSLFISMLRSLGIPARFVSGISYTNLPEFSNPWGGHGWAEVWFPRTGWVPFDVTYGTYGYIDATHIKLEDSFDAQKSSVEFLMRGSDASLLTQSLDIAVDIFEQRGEQQNLFDVTFEPFDRSIGFSSYNLLSATVANTANQYVSARLTLSQTEGLELVGEPERNILLKPHETQKIHYLVKVGELKSGFVYTFPAKLFAGFQEIASTEFEVAAGFGDYKKSLFDEYLEVITEEKVYNKHVSLACNPVQPATYLDESLEIDCTLENSGPGDLTSVHACIGETCTRIDVPSGEQSAFTTKITCNEPGIHNLFATAENFRITKSALAGFECMDAAAVSIAELSGPSELGFADEGDIRFHVVKESETVPQSVIVRIEHDNFAQEWSLAHLSEPTLFSLRVLGQNLDIGENEVAVVVTYKDKLGLAGESRATLQIGTANLTFGEKFHITLQNIQRFVEELFT